MPSLFDPKSAPEDGEGPRWQRRADARPAELLAAALDLFVERGYANTRLDDVAARAGVSKGTLYLYYANKEDLLKAVVRAGLISPLLEAREVIARFPGTSAELLGLVVHGWWERIGRSALSGIPKLILAEARNFPEIARFYFEEVVQPGQATMAEVIQRGIDRGEFRKVDAMHAAHLLTAPFLLIGSWRTSMVDPDSAGREDPRFLDAPALLELHLDMLLRGLAPESRKPGLDMGQVRERMAARMAARQAEQATAAHAVPEKKKPAAGKVAKSRAAATQPVKPIAARAKSGTKAKGRS
jgi:AcrR family transcriptional regulator